MSLKDTHTEYLRWLRFTLNPLQPMPVVQNWKGLFEFACQHAIAGICEPTRFDNARLDPDILFKWMGLVVQLRAENKHHVSRIEELSNKLKIAGFHFCILKGQGNALMYPDWELRTPGDIDVWVDTDEQSLLDYVKVQFPEKEETFKHITFPIFDDVGIDMHSTPLKLYCPKFNKKLQMWLVDNKDEQMLNDVVLAGASNPIAIPTAEFNAVYQLGHMMIHLFSWGVGLRQMVDYYYVLKNLEDTSYDKKQKIVETWKSLGLSRMASAVMWIETEILGLAKNMALIEPNEYYGRIIFTDVLEGGNFGKYSKWYKYFKQSYIRRPYALYRLVKLYSVFPTEAFYRIAGRSIKLCKKIL